MATISENIKRIQNKTRINARRLGEESGHQILYPYKIEGGVVTKPSVQTIQKIAKSLGVPMEKF